jgi:hypothetical protein
MSVNTEPDDNIDAVYGAELALQADHPNSFGKEIKPHQARRLSKHILNHPALDDIPGIDKARKSIATKISVRTGIIDRLAPGMAAATNFHGTTLYSKKSPITVGTVSHETAHKILVHGNPEAKHGPEFTALHEHIMTHVFNDRRGKTRKYYNEFGAK